MEKTYTKNKYNQCFFVCMSLLPHTPPAIFTQVCAKREKCSALKGSIWLEQVVELLPMVKKKKEVYCSLLLKSSKKWYASLKIILISRPKVSTFSVEEREKLLEQRSLEESTFVTVEIICMMWLTRMCSL